MDRSAGDGERGSSARAPIEGFAATAGYAAVNGNCNVAGAGTGTVVIFINAASCGP